MVTEAKTLSGVLSNFAKKTSYKSRTRISTNSLATRGSFTRYLVG